MTPLLLAGTILIALAGLFHVAIFAMESILWRQPQTWRRFGVRSQADADTVAPMAYNQGFYNLFLAVGTVGGCGMLWFDALPQAGAAIMLFSAASMVLAALVLVLSDRRLARAAAIQGAAPLLGVLLVIVSAL